MNQTDKCLREPGSFFRQTYQLHQNNLVARRNNGVATFKKAIFKKPTDNCIKTPDTWFRQTWQLHQNNLVAPGNNVVATFKIASKNLILGFDKSGNRIKTI